VATIGGLIANLGFRRVMGLQLLDFFSQDEVIKNCEFDVLGLSNSITGLRVLSYIDDRRFTNEANNNNEICALITTKEIYKDICFSEHIRGMVIVEKPRNTFFTLHNELAKRKDYNSIKCRTVVGNNCIISGSAIIDECGVVIGDNVLVEDFVKIEGPCVIGNNTIIHSGAKIGGPGFEFKRSEYSILDVVHCGGVLIGENVVIWENVSIHRAVYPWDNTLIGNWCRIGAQTHIDHGAKISDYVEICARCTVSGRVIIGNHGFVGPGSIISNRINVGNDGKILIGSVVTKNVPEGAIVSGNFAIEHEKHMERVKADSNIVFR